MPHGMPRSAPYSICRRDDQPTGLLEQAPVGARMTSDGIRYSNIEPDQEISAAPRADRRQRPPEPEPVLAGHVALGDGDEAREPRLGGKQVVAVGVERAVARRGSRSRAAAAPGRSRKPNSIASIRCVRSASRARFSRAARRRRAGRASSGRRLASIASAGSAAHGERRERRAHHRAAWPSGRQARATSVLAVRATSVAARLRAWLSELERRARWLRDRGRERVRPDSSSVSARRRAPRRARARRRPASPRCEPALRARELGRQRSRLSSQPRDSASSARVAAGARDRLRARSSRSPARLRSAIASASRDARTRSAGAIERSRHPRAARCASAIRWPARLPLSTVET